MSVLIFVISIITFAFFIWLTRKITELIKHRNDHSDSDHSPTEFMPNENSPVGLNSCEVDEHLKNPEGRRVFDSLMLMSAETRRARSSARHKPHPSSMRRASLQNGSMRIRANNCSHRVTPRPNGVPRRHPLLPITGGTVQIEVPVVVMVPPTNSAARPVTVLYREPPPPFEEDLPPAYDDLFGPPRRQGFSDVK